VYQARCPAYGSRLGTPLPATLLLHSDTALSWVVRNVSSRPEIKKRFALLPTELLTQARHLAVGANVTVDHLTRALPIDVETAEYILRRARRSAKKRARHPSVSAA